MKILLYCPTYKVDGKRLALHKRTQESIHDLIVPDGVELDFVIAHNNPHPRTGVSKVDHENTLYQYRQARLRVLNESYDALFIVEHDMIIPEDALVRMLATDADVVYGLYMFRKGLPLMNCLRATTGRWIDMSVTNFPELIRKGKRQGWLECSGAGFGCTLISRAVLLKLDFHRADTGHPIPDMPFANDCIQNGYKQVCRFDVPCGHIKPDGEVLYPFRKGGHEMGDRVKIYVYTTFNALVDSGLRHFVEGEETDVPKEFADDYVRAGFIGIVKDKPAVKIANKPKSKGKKAVK
jgi:hypothetical protein